MFLFIKRTRPTILLLRQLAMFLKSGMTLPESIAALDDFPYRRIRQKLRSIRQSLADGVSMGEAVAGNPELFGRLPTELLAQGLSSRELGDIFNGFADEREKISTMKQRMKRALLYPIATLLIGMQVLTVLMVFVMPAFEKMFADFGGSLPAPTRTLIELSSNFDHIVLGLVVVIVAILVLWYNRPSFLYALGSRLPGLSSVLRRSSVYFFARDLSLFVRAGLSPGLSMQNAASRLHFLPFSRKVKSLPAEGSLREVLAEVRHLPEVFLQVVGVGERTDNLAEALVEFSNYYEKEVESAYYRLLAATEILSLVMVAGMIGWAVSALYLPIFQLARTVG